MLARFNHPALVKVQHFWEEHGTAYMVMPYYPGLTLADTVARHDHRGNQRPHLTVILKPGYAPIEQYGELSGVRQGPWTDLYALAATMYFCITGKRPPDAAARVMDDKLTPLSTLSTERYSPSLLVALERALIVSPEHRTRSVEAFRADLQSIRAQSGALSRLHGRPSVHGRLATNGGRGRLRAAWR